MKEIRIPQGMRDLIVEECAKKRFAQKTIERVFQSFGYEEIMTPSIEYFDTYQQGFSEVDATEMYKFFDQDGEILTLREDMTVPICRVCASKYANSKPPFRFFYTSNVFKVRHVFAGKRGEVTDCGVECIGLDEKSDIEILYMAIQVMEKLHFKNYQIEIGNAKLFQSAVDALQLDKADQKKLAALIDQKSIVDLNCFVEALHLPEEAQDFFTQLSFLSGNDVFEKAKQLCFTEEMQAVIDQLVSLYAALQTLGVAEHISFDLGKIPHLDYYTGIIFEGFIEESGTSVLSGGRYDNLMQKFDRDLPACGFSMKLDYILDALDNQNKEVVQLYYPKGKEIEAIQKADEIRKNKDVEMIPWNRDAWEVRQ